MQPNSQLVLRPAPAMDTYGGISAYMKAVANTQCRADVIDTLAHLTQLCDLNATPNLIQAKPFLLIAACFYLNAVIQKGRYTNRVVLLLEMVLEACGIEAKRYKQYAKDREWIGLNAVIDAIYNHHKPAETSRSPPTDQPYHTNSLTNA